MRFSNTLFIMAVMTFFMMACGKKKTTDDIIASKPAVKVSASPVRMQDYVHKEDIVWLGKSYAVEIKRNADTELPVISDDSGNKYYDNKISVSVMRSDGTVFFERIFSKADFSSYITEDYMEKSALLGIVLEKVDGSNLHFAASVGAPDVLSDDYMPLIMSLSRLGNVSIRKDMRLDSDGGERSGTSDDGI